MVDKNSEKWYLLTTGDVLQLKLLETDGTLLHKGSIFTPLSSVISTVFQGGRVSVDHNTFQQKPAAQQ